MSLFINSKTKLGSVEIIKIKIGSQAHNVIPSLVANLLAIITVFHGLIEEISAVMLCKFLVQTLWHKVEVLVKLWERWKNIITPVCRTVTHDESLQVYRHLIRIIWPNLSQLIILVNLIGQVWRVNSTIALTRNEQGIVSIIFSRTVLRELGIPCSQRSVSIFGLNHIVVYHFFLLDVPWGKSDTSWRLKIDHTSISDPWVWILSNIGSIVLNDPWAVFLHKTEQGRTARTTIKPNENWIGLWIIL